MGALFRHEGPSRSPRKNAELAGYLALVAGYVNSGGFILIGSFTSHVTGNVGRLSNDIALGDAPAALLAAFMVLAFFAGAVASSMILEWRSNRGAPRAYAAALAFEGLLLLVFVFVAGLSRATHPRVLDAEAAILSAAMGAQNALVTRLSGAVVRTTHLTGVVTDLAIELSGWYRHHRGRASRPSHAPRGGGGPPPLGKVALLLVILVAFVVGAGLGALLTFRASRWAMIAPAAAVFAAAAYAFLTKKSPAP
jgi:uncharacterized membrane protein YoaK (UPF0700 family)